MEKKKIQIEYSKKISLISKFNKFYYDDNNPKVNDQKYKFQNQKKNINFLNLIDLLQKLQDLNHLKTFKK